MQHFCNFFCTFASRMIYINDQIDLLSLDNALPLLSPQRREQVLRFKYEQGRRLSAAAYLLLCEGLRQEFGINEPPTFGYHNNGKPFIEGYPEVHFNLSHCREAAICAVSHQPVGIDVESIREYHDTLARYTMNDEEMELITHAARPDVAFIRLWTMKESLLKLTGEGIRKDMKEVLTDYGSKVTFTTAVNLQKGYVYTLCTFLFVN